MEMMTRSTLGKWLLVCVALIFLSFILKKEKPTLYIIGDSTVKNGDGTGRNGQWGWGSFIAEYFDTTKIKVENHAIGGRSSRTFITEGRWDRILSKLKKRDFVIMQFGHNDAGPLDDTARARGTIRGLGDESREIYNPITKKQEVVHTYGWYMRKYVDDTRTAKAIPIVCSPIPRDDWADGRVKRSDSSYSGWSRQVASEKNAFFIDLNNKIALKYESLGKDSVHKFFPTDHTHTDKAGARLNAAIVIDELRSLKGNPFKKYLLPSH